MTADWMVYCALWSLPVSAGAWLAERLLRRGRTPLRGVWVAALCLGVAGPAIGYLLPRRAPAPVVAPSSSRAAPSPDLTIVRWYPSTPRLPSSSAPTAVVDWLAIGWTTMSVLMLSYVALGFLRLAYLRRRWQVARVGDTPVMLSDDVGPAVVGVIRGTIVLPRWVLALDHRQLALVVRHEREHQRAGDTALLTLAQLVLVATPWNPLAWWQVRRLRLAIEMDCDARVLRAEPDVRSYGSLLLEVVRPRTAFAFAGAALSDRASDLETRIRMMTRKAAGVSRAGVAAAIAAGFIVIAIGCGLPAPQHPSRTASTPAKPPADTARATTASTSASAAQDSALYERMTKFYAAARAHQDSVERGKLRTPSTSADTAAEVEARKNALLISQLDSLASSIRNRRRALPDSAAMAEMVARGELSDSQAAAATTAGCAAGAGPDDAVVVKLLVSDSAAARDGRIEIDGSNSADNRTGIRLSNAAAEPGLECTTARTGTVRLFGAGAFEGPPIGVRTARPTTVVVATGSGVTLVEPVTIVRENRRYVLAWSARKP